MYELKAICTNTGFKYKQKTGEYDVWVELGTRGTRAKKTSVNSDEGVELWWKDSKQNPKVGIVWQ